MSNIKYKYNLNHLYSLTPREISLPQIVRQLEKHGVPRSTFFRDRALLPDQIEDIPARRLLIYARFFGVSVDALYNYDVKVKSINKR